MADAAEKKARYACLVDRGGRELLFEDIARTTEHNPREVGTRDEAAYYVGTFARGASVVRILEDGEYEAAIARAEKAEARAERNEREAAAYEALVMQAILGKGIASIKTEDAPKLLARLIERGLEAEWGDAGEEPTDG